MSFSSYTFFPRLHPEVMGISPKPRVAAPFSATSSTIPDSNGFQNAPSWAYRQFLPITFGGQVAEVEQAEPVQKEAPIRTREEVLKWLDSLKVPSGPDGAKVKLEDRTLIEPTLSIDGIHEKFTLEPKDGKPASMWFATGVSTTNKESAGIPFDFIGYLATAETVRKKLGIDKVYFSIGDIHALGNPYTNKAKVREMADETKRIADRILKYFGLSDHYEVFMSSSLREKPEYKKLYRQIYANELRALHEQRLAENLTPIDYKKRQTKARYVARQLADMKYFHEEHNAVIRISWAIDRKKGSAKYDERMFDGKYRAYWPEDNFSFIYTVPGRTPARERPRACPYTASYEDIENGRLTLGRKPKIRERLRAWNRLIKDMSKRPQAELTPEERLFTPTDTPEVNGVAPLTADEKADFGATESALNYLIVAVSMFEKAFRPLGTNNLESKIRHINAIATLDDPQQYIYVPHPTGVMNPNGSVRKVRATRDL